MTATGLVTVGGGQAFAPPCRDNSSGRGDSGGGKDLSPIYPLGTDNDVQSSVVGTPPPLVVVVYPPPPAAETREERRRRIGRENVYGAPLGGTATAASMAPSPSPAEEERPTKKRPDQRIGFGIAQAASVS